MVNKKALEKQFNRIRRYAETIKTPPELMERTAVWNERLRSGRCSLDEFTEAVEGLVGKQFNQRTVDLLRAALQA